MKRNGRRASAATLGGLIAARQVPASSKGEDLTAKLYSACPDMTAASIDAFAKSLACINRQLKTAGPCA